MIARLSVVFPDPDPPHTPTTRIWFPSIFNKRLDTTTKQCACISKWAAGIGISMHNIRGTNSYIRSTNGSSNGIIPMLRVFNDTARLVDQGGGKRKGSFVIYLEPWHAAVLEFLELRKNHGNELHLTPLVLAARRGHLAVVLLERCETGGGDDDYGLHSVALCSEAWTPHCGQQSTLNGANVDAICTQRHSSPLHLAAKSVFYPLTLTMMQKIVQAQNGLRSLYIAAYCGYKSVVKLLLDHGAELEATSVSNKTTPLRGAVSKGRTDVVELLLAHGADTNAVLPTDGTTALHSAAANGFVDILKMLIATRADPTAWIVMDGLRWTMLLRTRFACSYVLHW
ncbi:hypothetical protein PsorP6_011155 [Peronosclerospora sorghi]|uniref:Uncharacterized protein n=1 Tax=Peronosclerospora sorghi TaxID=230839 RepID=A0ACC0VV34_9STRA|nr:hypothetical protein PsorP6_011155 [Peronosclerospora sorghi]